MLRQVAGTVVGGWLGAALADAEVAPDMTPADMVGTPVDGALDVQDVTLVDEGFGSGEPVAEEGRLSMAEDVPLVSGDAAAGLEERKPRGGMGTPERGSLAGVWAVGGLGALLRRLVGGSGALMIRPEQAPLLDLDEPSYRDLCDIAMLDRERMPSLVEFSSGLTPEQRDVLRRYRDAFFEPQPLPEDLEARAFRIFYDALPRSAATGGLLACYHPGEKRLHDLAIALNHQPTAAESARAQALGLLLFSGGRLAIEGTRHLPGWLDSTFTGYHTYTAEDGRRFYSLQPLDAVTPEDIVDLYRFIKERTLAHGIMAEPMGIHFYRGQPRILFEILGGRRMFGVTNKDTGLAPDFEARFDAVMSPRLLSHKRIYGRFGDDTVLEEDYMFINDGKLRIGLQVRVGEFIGSVKNGQVFRLAR